MKDCSHTAARISRQGAKIATLVMMWVFVILALVLAVVPVARAAAQDAQTRDILHRAMEYQIRFRAGDYNVVTDYVAMLEAATKASPDSADLWYAMGRAHLVSGARAMLPGGNQADAAQGMQKGLAALRRALQLNPEHPLALSLQAGAQSLMASFAGAPAMATKAVAQMNRAVELAPDSTVVRLQRAFSGLNLPDELRNHAHEAEDLDWLAEKAEYSTAGDFIRVMRADLHYELGEKDKARELYGMVGASATTASPEAKSRLAAMDKGGVPMADIKTLRSAAGAQCTMCHVR